jgi:hypothetical protein
MSLNNKLLCASAQKFYFPNRKYNFLKNRIRATATCTFAKARRKPCFLYLIIETNYSLYRGRE